MLDPADLGILTKEYLPFVIMSEKNLERVIE